MVASTSNSHIFQSVRQSPVLRSLIFCSWTSSSYVVIRWGYVLLLLQCEVWSIVLLGWLLILDAFCC